MPGRSSPARPRDRCRLLFMGGFLRVPAGRVSSSRNAVCGFGHASFDASRRASSALAVDDDEFEEGRSGRRATCGELLVVGQRDHHRLQPAPRPLLAPAAWSMRQTWAVVARYPRRARSLLASHRSGLADGRVVAFEQKGRGTETDSVVTRSRPSAGPSRPTFSRPSGRVAGAFGAYPIPGAASSRCRQRALLEQGLCRCQQLIKGHRGGGATRHRAHRSPRARLAVAGRWPARYGVLQMLLRYRPAHCGRSASIMARHWHQACPHRRCGAQRRPCALLSNSSTERCSTRNRRCAA